MPAELDSTYQQLAESGRARIDVITNVLLNISGDRESVLGSLKDELSEQHNAMTQMEREERRAEVDGQAEDEGVMDEQKLSEKLDTLVAFSA